MPDRPGRRARPARHAFAVPPLPALAVLATFGLVLAGCAEPPAAAPVELEREPVPLGFVATGPAVGPDLDATTAAPPRLVEGEWWRIRFSGDSLYEGIDVYRVVANATEDGYIFGMPHEGWLKEAISYHSPAFGDVGLDLSYDTHNLRFEPVRFPLVQGATWETTFATAPMVATVESADTHTAQIVFRAPPSDPEPTDPVMAAMMGGADLAIRMTYDARVHEVVRMESFIGTWEVIEHGYDFRGWVSVPDNEHTAIDYGTFGPDPDNPLPGRTVEVGDEFNRITVMHFIQGITPGLFRITSTPPNGQSVVTELSGAGSAVSFFEVDNPGGPWQQEDLAVGAGATYTMGIAYQQYDILVPDGERRGSHGHEVVR